MNKTPISESIVREAIKTCKVENVGLASIRELTKIVAQVEKESGLMFIRMEMGIPGFSPPRIAVDAEIKAIESGVGSLYPPFAGTDALKNEISEFVKNFLNVKVSPECCLPTVGGMQGCFLSMMVAGRRTRGKNRILFLDPGFPVNKLQAKVLGLETDRFDVYDYRGKALEKKIESYLAKGDTAAIIYSNPNNPSWICFTDEELKIIGELATRYDIVVLEDLAYLGMDFRKDCSVPGEKPFIPTVADYTDNYVLIMSGSKSFSLAGQRIGMVAIADKLYRSKGDGLEEYFESDQFGYSFTYGAMYTICSGVCHSTQAAMTALLKAANEGKFNFVGSVKEYGERAKRMKEIFKKNGFTIVYDLDVDQPIADGFYFTVAYPGLSGPELVEELLYYGISAISLSTTGSDRHEGIRVCVSLTGLHLMDVLENRLARFHENRQAGYHAGGNG